MSDFIIPLVLILSYLGFAPVWESAKTATYELSFGQIFVNKQRNRWFCPSLKLGGTGADLLCYILGLPKDIAREELVVIAKYIKDKYPTNFLHKAVKNTCRITGVDEITSANLFRVIQNKGLPVNIVTMHCLQVSYCNPQTGAAGYGFGFRNESGGYGIITSLGLSLNLQASDVTVNRIFRADKDKCLLFMGPLDYLAYITVNGELVNDSVIMFSSGNVERAIPHLRGYREIQYFVPNTPAKDLTMPTLKSSGLPIRDMSYLYVGYNNYRQRFLPQKKGHQTKKS